MKRAQGQGDGDQTQGAGSEWGRAGRAPTAPAPPALTSEDAGAELFWFSLFPLSFSFPSQSSQFGGCFYFGFFLFCFCFIFVFSFSTSGNFCILFNLKRKEKKISLNETKPKEPIFDLGSLAGC